MTTTRTTEITTTARRVARAHNGYLGMGGKLVFGRDGSGGQWYSAGSYGFGADTIVVPVSHAKMTETEAQRLLDDMADPESW